MRLRKEVFVLAHMIEINDNMFSVRTMPWHGLGVVIQEAPNSEEALQVAKLDWNVFQKPVFQDLSDGNDLNSGEYAAIPGYCANVRSDTNQVLGIVTPHYKIVQNTEAFGTLLTIDRTTTKIGLSFYPVDDTAYTREMKKVIEKLYPGGLLTNQQAESKMQSWYRKLKDVFKTNKGE